MALQSIGRILNIRTWCLAPRVASLHTTPIMKEMNDPLDHATGIEKRELLAQAGGNQDPFMLKTIIKRGPGTRECPTLIPSAFEGRLMGCVCSGNRFVQWMWIEKGCPKRCECGHWFQLKEVPPV